MPRWKWENLANVGKKRKHNNRTIVIQNLFGQVKGVIQRSSVWQLVQFSPFYQATDCRLSLPEENQTDELAVSAQVIPV